MANEGFNFGKALILAITLVSVASYARPSLAGEPGSDPGTAVPVALELSEEARERYDRGEYERALVLFNEAHAREPDPNLLFNIARCHEKLGQPQAAIDKYEEFLASPNGDPTGREKAEASRDQLVQARDRKLARGKSGKAESRATGDESGESVPVPDDSPNLTPWLLLGAGVAAVTSGAIVYSLGISDHHQLENQAGYGDPNRVVPMTQKDAEARVASGSNKKLVGGLLLGGGGALLASSALVFVLDSGESSTKVGVDVSRRGGAIAIRGRF
jgi:tetratricopeptide (TPR) repeat protein